MRPYQHAINITAGLGAGTSASILTGTTTTVTAWVTIIAFLTMLILAAYEVVRCSR
jgi:hypothetical protein